VARLGIRVPAGDRAHLLLAPQAQCLGPEDVLEQDAERVRKALEIGLGAESAEPSDRVRPPAGLDLSQCSVVLSGGAILSPAVKTELAEKLPGSVVVDGYGASETGGQGQSVPVAGAEPSPTPRLPGNAPTTAPRRPSTN